MSSQNYSKLFFLQSHQYLLSYKRLENDGNKILVKIIERKMENFQFLLLSLIKWPVDSLHSIKFRIQSDGLWIRSNSQYITEPVSARDL